MRGDAGCVRVCEGVQAGAGECVVRNGVRAGVRLSTPTLTSSAATTGCSAWKLPTANARQSASSQMVYLLGLGMGLGLGLRVG